MIINDIQVELEKQDDIMELLRQVEALQVELNQQAIAMRRQLVKTLQLQQLIESKSNKEGQ